MVFFGKMKSGFLKDIGSFDRGENSRKIFYRNFLISGCLIGVVV